MAEEGPVKRRRTGLASSPSNRVALSEEQVHAIEGAKRLERALAIDEQFCHLRNGQVEAQQLAWSPHNLIAYASSTTPSTRAVAHVVLQCLDPQRPASCRRAPHPSFLYPDQSFAGSQNSIALPIASHYDDPRNISFSPCGYYLCAYFPLRKSILQKQPSVPASPQTAQLVDATISTAEHAAESITEPHQAASTPALGRLSGSSNFGLTSHLASLAVPARIPAPSGTLCIWSRADSGALNDWNLVQAIPVENNSAQSSKSAKRSSNNVLEVNEQGQQIEREDSKSSLDNRASSESPFRLHGDIKQIVWMNQRRKYVLSTSKLTRLPCRGPCFLPSGEAEAGPDTDLALLVFGKHGQVSLLYSREADRLRASTTDGSSTPSFPGTFFRTLQAFLHEPDLQPAPFVLGSQADTQTSRNNDASSHTSLFVNDEGPCISHLAVGLPANDSTVLVASKRSPHTHALIDLAEVTIDLRGESVSMTTRPIQTTAIVPTAWTNAHEDTDDAQDSCEEACELTCLSWAEVEQNSPQGDAAKVASLKLVASFSYLKGQNADAARSAQSISGDWELNTIIKVWDVWKTENELSDAFGSLECRKAGHVPKFLDWSLRLAGTSSLAGKAVTSLKLGGTGIANKNLGLISALVACTSVDSAPVERFFYMDLTSIEVVPFAEGAIPSQALVRSSSPVCSPNGALVAALAQLHLDARPKKLLLWKLPLLSPPPSHSGDRGENSDEQAKFAQLIALASVRKTDTTDITRAFAPVTSIAYDKALVDVGNLLHITESKRQDIVKMESSEQKLASQPNCFGHVLRLLQLRMSMGLASDNAADRLERLVLELSLCYQALRLSRVKVELQDLSKEDTKKGVSTPPSHHARVYYRLESVWALLAQLQWLLDLLGQVGRLALESEFAPASAASAASSAVGAGIVRMLRMPTPRRLLLQILAYFCDFKEWLTSTTKRENLPTMPTSGERNGTNTVGLFPIADSEGGMLAVSEQMSLARDALSHVLVTSSVELEGFVRILEREVEQGEGEGEQGPWWAKLSGFGRETGGQSSELDRKVLGSIVDPSAGALADVLSLFLSPVDLLNEHNVLQDGCVAVSAAGGAHARPARDIIRKISLRNAVTQSKLLQHNALSAFQHTQHAHLPPSMAPATSSTTVMRAKFCLRCHALSQDPVVVTYHTVPGSSATLLDTSIHRQMQMHLQNPLAMHRTHITSIRVKRDPAAPVSILEATFRYTCLCGGVWWAL